MTTKRNSVICPRCGYQKASPNARGPNVIWCARCGGLVPIDYHDVEGPYSDDPIRSAVAHESGIHASGRTLRYLTKHLRGGL